MNFVDLSSFVAVEIHKKEQPLKIFVCLTLLLSDCKSVRQQNTYQHNTEKCGLEIRNTKVIKYIQDPWQFLQIIDLDTGGKLNGATGIVVAGTDINKSYEININLFKYLCIFPVTFTQVSINVNIQLRDNG